MNQIRPLFLINETPLHAGSGHDLGIIDLPIQREKHTGYPKVEASGLRGALRELFENSLREFNGKKIEKLVKTVFGPENDTDNYKSALQISDMRLLLFPVKSVKGVFAYITCPQVLSRFVADMQRIYGKKFKFERDPKAENNGCQVQSVNNITMGRYIILEEYTYENKGEMPKLEIKSKDKDEKEIKIEKTLGEWLTANDLAKDNAWRTEKLKKDIIVVSDDSFKDFVKYSTECITRTQIENDTGTVKTGALFTEEFLPTESVMYSMISTTGLFTKNNNEVFTKKAESVMEYFDAGLEPLFQLGGDASLGKGLMRTKLFRNPTKTTNNE